MVMKDRIKELRRVPASELDVCPGVAFDYVTDSSPMNRVSFSQPLVSESGSMQLTYLHNLSLGQESFSISLTSISAGVNEIGRPRNVFKIVQSVIPFIRISVVHFMLSRTTPQKCLSHQTMDQSGIGFIAKGQRRGQIVCVVWSIRNNAINTAILAIMYSAYAAFSACFKVWQARYRFPVFHATIIQREYTP